MLSWWWLCRGIGGIQCGHICIFRGLAIVIYVGICCRFNFIYHDKVMMLKKGMCLLNQEGASEGGCDGVLVRRGDIKKARKLAFVYIALANIFSSVRQHHQPVSLCHYQ